MILTTVIHLYGTLTNIISAKLYLLSWKPEQWKKAVWLISLQLWCIEIQLTLQYLSINRILSLKKNIDFSNWKRDIFMF